MDPVCAFPVCRRSRGLPSHYDSDRVLAVPYQNRWTSAPDESEGKTSHKQESANKKHKASSGGTRSLVAFRLRQQTDLNFLSLPFGSQPRPLGKCPPFLAVTRTWTLTHIHAHTPTHTATATLNLVMSIRVHPLTARSGVTSITISLISRFQRPMISSQRGQAPRVVPVFFFTLFPVLPSREELAK